MQTFIIFSRKSHIYAANGTQRQRMDRLDVWWPIGPGLGTCTFPLTQYRGRIVAKKYRYIYIYIYIYIYFSIFCQIDKSFEIMNLSAEECVPVFDKNDHFDIKD